MPGIACFPQHPAVRQHTFQCEDRDRVGRQVDAVGRGWLAAECRVFRVTNCAGGVWKARRLGRGTLMQPSRWGQGRGLQAGWRCSFSHLAALTFAAASGWRLQEPWRLPEAAAGRWPGPGRGGASGAPSDEGELACARSGPGGGGVRRIGLGWPAERQQSVMRITQNIARSAALGTVFRPWKVTSN